MAARQWMSLALGWIGLAASATGCTDDGVSLHVICPIPPAISDDACTWDPGSDLCVAEGVMNLTTATTYRLSLRVQSGLKARMRDIPVVAEPNGMYIDRARVELRVPDGAVIRGLKRKNSDGTFTDVPNPYSVSASGYVAPAGNAIVGVTVLGPEQTAALSSGALQQVVVAVKLHGKTNGQEDVDSSEFLWPIDLIKASPYEADRQCVSGRAFCTLGQDEGAYVCIDGSST
jgi:hypothetical protein